MIEVVFTNGYPDGEETRRRVCIRHDQALASLRFSRGDRWQTAFDEMKECSDFLREVAWCD